jgi:hypothetical protein
MELIPGAKYPEGHLRRRGIQIYSSAYQQLAILKFPWLYGFGEKFYGYRLRNYKFTNSGKRLFKRKKKRFEQDIEAYAK